MSTLNFMSFQSNSCSNSFRTKVVDQPSNICQPSSHTTVSAKKNQSMEPMTAVLCKNNSHKLLLLSSPPTYILFTELFPDSEWAFGQQFDKLSSNTLGEYLNCYLESQLSFIISVAKTSLWSAKNCSMQKKPWFKCKK